MNLSKMLDNTIKEAKAPGIQQQDASTQRKKVGYQRMIDILSGQEKFEGEIDSPERFRAVIDAIENESFKVPSALKKMSKEVGKIIKKIEDGKNITEKESDISDDFADKVEDILFSETYIKRQTARSEGGSGGKANRARFSNSIPVKFTSDAGKNYYGLITPPTGFIAWQSKDAYNVVKSDPELKIPPRLDLLSDVFKINKTKYVADLLKDVRFNFKDDDESKKKVEDAFSKHGASINKKGELPGIEKVVKKVEFWKDIAKIF